jgi:hypothetical protein
VNGSQIPVIALQVAPRPQLSASHFGAHMPSPGSHAHAATKGTHTESAPQLPSPKHGISGTWHGPQFDWPGAKQLSWSSSEQSASLRHAPGISSPVVPSVAPVDSMPPVVELVESELLPVTTSPVLATPVVEDVGSLVASVGSLAPVLAVCVSPVLDVSTPASFSGPQASTSAKV